MSLKLLKPRRCKVKLFFGVMLFFTIMSTNSLADWQKKLIVEEAAYNDQFISILMSRWEVFKNYDPSDYKLVKYGLIRYAWTGETTCSSTDSRLVKDIPQIELCLKDDHNQIGSCMQSSSPSLEPWDPCK